MYTYV